MCLEDKHCGRRKFDGSVVLLDANRLDVGVGSKDGVRHQSALVGDDRKIESVEQGFGRVPQQILFIDRQLTKPF